MTVPAGFSVELVASEPEIVNPIALAFDDRGRAWVTESLEYPRKSAGPGRDRVKILEDTDGDGRADRFTVFAADLNIPTGVAIGHGGVWVLNAPDLLFLREKDGKEVSRELVVSGFGRADTHELASTLTWGPDGWLYGFNGVFNPSRIKSGDKEYNFTCALWRVHPRTREFQVFAEGTSNPYGLAWDTEGSALVEACHWANDHLFHFVETGYYQRQAGAYPPYTMRIGSITDHSHQKTAYCGLAFFDSDAYPEAYRERLYTGNIHGNCINADRLSRDGSTYIATAEPDFLTANDAWFMPVAQKVGPDGCLYILDWYDRYHCYQDANRDPEGIDRLKGRLYRVRYKNSPRAPRFNLAAESDAQLVARLSSPNIYFRETAQRLLTERNSAPIRSMLKNLVLDDSAPRKARMHALWALVGTGSLEPDFHLRLLAHADPAYRAWGVRAAGNFRRVGPAVSAQVARLARQSSPDVQLQVSIAARKIEGIDPLPVLVDVLAYCGEDKLIPSIVWPNLHPLVAQESDRFLRLAGRVDLKTAPALAKLLPRVVERLLSEQNMPASSIGHLIALLVERDADLAKKCLSIVSNRMNEIRDTRRGELRAQLQPIVARILADSPDGLLGFSAALVASQLRIGRVDPDLVRDKFLAVDQPEAVRLEALEALIAFKDPALLEAVSHVLSSGSVRFLEQVLAALGRSNDPKVADLVLARYPKMDAALQQLAIDLLMQREAWTRKLLDAVQKQELPRSVLHANHLRKIVESNDREAIWAVEKTWGTVRAERNPEREKVVAEMSDFFRKTPGDPKAGQRVFRNFCAQCHTIYGEGGKVGPDITSNGRASFEQLVSNVFDPSLVIGSAYQVTMVVTNDERYITGIVTEDSAERIVVAMAGGGQESIARNNVKYTKVSKLSMMPEGIEHALGRQDLVDLFAFLALDRPPGDPQAKRIPGAPAWPVDGFKPKVSAAPDGS